MGRAQRCFSGLESQTGGFGRFAARPGACLRRRREACL